MSMVFKESQLVKNQKRLIGNKRDGRKKFIKSTTPQSDLKRPVTKKQMGGNIFTTYNSITPYSGPVFEQPEIKIQPLEIPVNRLEANRRKVMAKEKESEKEPEKKEEPATEVSTSPLPTSPKPQEPSTPAVEAPTVFKTKEDFVKTMTPAFENALKAKGLDTKYAKYLVAQSALESNWGKSQSGKFNFGGIKGKGTVRRTREVIGGKDKYINDSFRDFKDINDYANYHVSLLNNKRYQAFNGDFIDSVVRGGYATDPNYKNALTNVYNQIVKGSRGMKVSKLQDGNELTPEEKMKRAEEVLIQKSLEFGDKTHQRIAPYNINLISYIKSKEGFRAKPEKDKTDGKLTVGYGLTDPVLIKKYKNGITEEEASRHLIQHLRRGSDSLETMPYYNDLNLDQKTALNDLIYNGGWYGFKNKSKQLQKHLNSGNFNRAVKEIDYGEHQARGLKIRRQENRNMFRGTFDWGQFRPEEISTKAPKSNIEINSRELGIEKLPPVPPIK